MVLKKKVDYGQNGFRVPVIPRGPRSVRRRYPLKRAVENKICAIELLASLAGKLLQESEISSASSNASEENGRPAFGRDVVRREQDDYRPPKAECVDNASCEESVYVSEAAMHKVNQACGNKESPHDDSDGNMECTSIVSSSDCPDKVHCDAKSVNLESKAVSRYLTCKLEESFPDYSDHFHSNVDKGIEKLGVYKGVSGDLTNSNLYNAEDKMVNTCKNSSKFNPIGIPVPDGSLSRHQNDIRLGSRDDDENFSRFKKASSKFKAFRPGARISNRRIRKLLTSKYWKTAPKLKDSEHSSTVKQRLRNDGAWRAIYNKRKSCYNNEKSKHGSLYKKQKLFDQSSVVISDGGFSGESVSNPPEKNLTGEKNGLAAKFSGVNGVSSSVKGHQSSFHTKSSHVKFRIKSFKVPELYIEVPESATVGSLKRTVMEAVTALFGGGLRIGVHHQGKKVRDDNRTLSQTGITHEENLETLGFALEPNLVQAPSPLRAEKSPSLPYENPQPLNRCAPTPVLDSGISDAPYKAPSLSNACNHDGSYDNSASHHTNMSPEKVVTDSRALVPVSPLSVEALAVVPVNQKTKRSEFSHRRTRRPFSVAEVEALVQAVEKLGTGRWRDVKLHAFEKSDHRTYVDLKDKWKTLVHTANISPQQRRGEPVPQELLDRVLAAQAYWSQHQAKPHGKHQVGTLKNSEVRGDNNGVAGMPLALM